MNFDICKVTLNLRCGGGTITIYMGKDEAIKKSSEIILKRPNCPSSLRDVHLQGFVLENKIKLAKEVFVDAVEVGCLNIVEAPLDEFVFNPEEVERAISKERVVDSG